MPVPWRRPTLWELGPELGIDLQVPWFDVTDNRFAGGADKTGTSDSTLAIQGALNMAMENGGVVLLPAGTYKTSAALTYKSSNTKQLTIRGAGKSATVIQQASGTSDVLLKSADNTANQQFLVIEDIGFSAFNNQTNNLGGLLFEKTSLSKLNRVLVSYCNNYLVQFLGGGTGGDVQDNAITESWLGNVLTNQSTSYQVYLNSSANSTPDGTRLRGVVFNSAAGTAVKTNKGSISRGYGPDFSMIGCSVQTTPNWYDVDGNAVRIIGNRFEVTSGTATITIASTAKRGARIGNSYAAPTLTISDSSPVGTTDEWIVADNHGASGGAVTRGFHTYDELLTIAEGFIAQTGSRKYVFGTSTTSAGTLRMAAVYLRAGMVLTNGWVSVATNGTGVTLAKVGVWKTDGTLLVATGDMSANINAGTVPRGQSGAFTAPYTVTADGLYWVGVLQVGGTPAILAEIGSNSTGSWSASGVLNPCPALSGQTDAVTFNPASLVSNGVIPWIGIT